MSTIKNQSKTYLASITKRKKHITISNILIFLLLGNLSYSIEKEKILGNKFKYSKGSFFSLKNNKKVKVNYLSEKIIQINGEYFDITTGEEVHITTISNYNNEATFTHDLKVKLPTLKGEISSSNKRERKGSKNSVNTTTVKPSLQNSSVSTGISNSTKPNQQINKPNVINITNTILAPASQLSSNSNLIGGSSSSLNSSKPFSNQVASSSVMNSPAINTYTINHFRPIFPNKPTPQFGNPNPTGSSPTIIDTSTTPTSIVVNPVNNLRPIISNNNSIQQFGYPKPNGTIPMVVDTTSTPSAIATNLVNTPSRPTTTNNPIPTLGSQPIIIEDFIAHSGSGIRPWSGSAVDPNGGELTEIFSYLSTYNAYSLLDNNSNNIADIFEQNGDWDSDGILNKDDMDWDGDIFDNTGGINLGLDTSKLIDINGGQTTLTSLVTSNPSNVNGSLLGIGGDFDSDGISNEKDQDWNGDGIIDNANLNNNNLLSHVGSYDYGFNFSGNNIVINNSNITHGVSSNLGQIGVNKGTITGISALTDYDGNGIDISNGMDGYESDIYNYGTITNSSNLVVIGQAIHRASAYNFGNIGNGITISNTGSHRNTIVGQNTSTSGTLYNYGSINYNSAGQTNGNGVARTLKGQTLHGTRAGYGEYLIAANYGTINLSTEGGTIEGQYSREGGFLLNYGVIDMQSKDHTYLNNSTNLGRLVGQSANRAMDGFGAYNYGTITGKAESAFTYGQLADSANLHNYGKISLESGEFSIGQSLAPNRYKNNVAYNYGTLENIGKTSYGQYIEEALGYNYGIISNKSTTDSSIGQGTFAGGQIYNFGIIDNYSENKDSFGQYVHGTGTLSENHGIIRVDRRNSLANGNNGEKFSSVGIYTEGGASSKNYSVIEVYNHGKVGNKVGSNIENISVGMVADGIGSKAYNYGKIKLDSHTRATNDSLGNSIDGGAMQALNGGEVYNYGTIEIGTINAANIPIRSAVRLGSQFASASAKYKINAPAIKVNGKIKVMPEAGLDSSATKNAFISGSSNILGTANIISSNNLYSITSTINNGNVDLKLNRNKNVNMSDSLTKEAKEVAKSLNLTEAVTNSKSFLNRNDKTLANYIMKEYNENNLQYFVDYDLQADIYTNLNKQILDLQRDTSNMSSHNTFAVNSYIEGEIFNGGGSGQATITNLANLNDYKVNATLFSDKISRDDTKDGRVNYDEKKVGAIVSLAKNQGMKADGFSLGYTQSRLDFDQDKGKGEINRFSTGYSWKNRINKFDITYNVGLGLNNHSYERNINFLTDQRKASSDFTSYDISMGLGISRRYDFDNYAITPYLGLDSAMIFRESFTEKGANGLDAKVKKNNTYSVEPKVGVTSEVTLYDNGKHKVGVEASVEYSKELGKLAKDSEKIGFKGFDGEYFAKDPIDKKGTINYGADLTYEVNNLKVNAGYRGNNHDDGQATIGFKYSW